jgi:hypothetical protein
MKSKLKVIVSILSLSLLVFASAVYASSLDKVQIIKISSRDQQAIIKTEEGKMRVVKEGEVILDDKEVQGAKSKVQPDKAKIVEITTGRIVLEETTKDGPETIIMRLEEKKEEGKEKEAQGSKGKVRAEDKKAQNAKFGVKSKNPENAGAKSKV